MTRMPDINSRASEGVARTRIELVLPPWEGGVSSFRENVDASLSNSVVAEYKQGAFV